jgi:hypothetical protein
MPSLTHPRKTREEENAQMPAVLTPCVPGWHPDGRTGQIGSGGAPWDGAAYGARCLLPRQDTEAVVIAVTGGKDGMGRSSYDTTWADEDGRTHGQCSFGDVSTAVARWEARGMTVRLVCVPSIGRN